MDGEDGAIELNVVEDEVLQGGKVVILEEEFEGVVGDLVVGEVQGLQLAGRQRLVERGG